MHDKVSVDVIIPCYNGEVFIDRCLESVMNQTSEICCIIIVDDGSTDKSYSRISEWSGRDNRIKILKQENRGLASARNAGMSISDATHIALLDVDDRWFPSKLKRQMDLAAADQNLLIASNYVNDVAGRLKQGIINCKRFEINSYNLLMFKSVIPGSGSSVLFPRKLIKEVGLFSESLSYGEDLDYWIRLSHFAQWTVVENPDVVIYQNQTGMQASRKLNIEPYLDSSLSIISSNRGHLSKFDYLSLMGYILFVGARASKQNINNYLKLLLIKFPLFSNWKRHHRIRSASILSLLAMGLFYSVYLKFIRKCAELKGSRINDEMFHSSQ